MENMAKWTRVEILITTQTVGVLMLRGVDGDPVSGLCQVCFTLFSLENVQHLKIFCRLHLLIRYY